MPHGFVRGLAKRAGELQLSRYGRPAGVREKGLKDLVTEVDLLCEELLVSAIAERYPQDGILAEERGGKISSADRTWVLDSLDGTANFSRGNPLFCASVSIVDKGKAAHTAVSIPLLGDPYHAATGGGAWRESRGATTPLRVTDTRALGYPCFRSGLRRIGQLLLRPQPRPLEVRRRPALRLPLGAALLGQFGHPRGVDRRGPPGRVGRRTERCAWDRAPTVLLVLEAGGRGTDLVGKPWTFASDGLLTIAGLLYDRVIETISG